MNQFNNEDQYQIIFTKRSIQNNIPNQCATRIIQNHERNVAANIANANTRGVIKNKYQN